jgi:hypothetical protein
MVFKLRRASERPLSETANASQQHRAEIVPDKDSQRAPLAHAISEQFGASLLTRALAVGPEGALDVQALHLLYLDAAVIADFSPALPNGGELSFQRDTMPQYEALSAVVSALAGAGVEQDPARFTARVRSAGSGRPLSAPERAFVAEAVGFDLPELRLHTGAVAGSAARAVGAHAFACGVDVYLPDNNPLQSPWGAEVLAHEATHVAQALQGRLPQPKEEGLQVSDPNDAHEREATFIGQRARALFRAFDAGLSALDVTVDPAADPLHFVQSHLSASVEAAQSQAAPQLAQQEASTELVSRNAVTSPEAGQSDVPVASKPVEQTPRQKFIAEYKTFLDARAAEIQELTGITKVRRIEGLLLQIETVSAQLAMITDDSPKGAAAKVGDVSSPLGKVADDGLNGNAPKVEGVSSPPGKGTFPDLTTLDTAPTSEPMRTPPPQPLSYVPPELISTVRALIRTLEVGVDGVPPATDSQVEGSKHSADDWSSRLGVPQYRTQSDNLTSPEATCNVTTFAMVLERLGYSRADVIAAVETELKKAWLIKQKRKPENEDLSKVVLPEGEWEKQLKIFLDKQDNRGKPYQKLRGVKSDTDQLANMAKTFQSDAQMEDILSFLMNLLGHDLVAVNDNAENLLRLIEPTSAERPSKETIWINKSLWPRVKERMRETLDAGGAVMISLYHTGTKMKGGEEAPTHLPFVQQVTNDGIVIDDPYGGMRSDYRLKKKEEKENQDAYADVGKKRKESSYANKVNTANDTKERVEDEGIKDEGDNLGAKDAVKGLVEANDGDKDKKYKDADWRVRQAQDPVANESRGASYILPDTLISSIGRFVSFFRRAVPTTAADTDTTTTQTGAPQATPSSPGPK